MFLKPSNGNPLYQYLAGFSATLAIVISGMQYGWPSPSLPILLDEKSPIKISEDIGYWLATGPTFGAIIGSLTTPLFVDRIGRHKSILLTAVPYLLSWILIAFSTNIQLLLVGRFIAGISDGWAFCGVPMYIGEITEPRIRGFLGSLISVSWIGGVLLINIIGSYFSLKMTALISSVVPIILVATFFFMPESPYFVIMKEDKGAVKKVLQILRGTDNVDKEILRIQEGIEAELSKKSNPLDLFRIPSNRKAIIIVLTLRGIQEFTGDSAITFYAQTIFKEAGTAISEDIASIIFFGLELLVTMSAALLIDKSGRRPLLIFSATGAAIALLVEGIYFYFKICTDADLSSVTLIPLIALFCFIVCFSAGLKVVPLLLLGEIFPQGVKAAAVCVADLSSVVFISSVSKFFQVTRDNFGMYIPFISFGVFCILGLIFVVFCVPETKGKTLEEIQDYFKGKKRSNEDNVEAK